MGDEISGTKIMALCKRPSSGVWWGRRYSQKKPEMASKQHKIKASIRINLMAVKRKDVIDARNMSHVRALWGGSNGNGGRFLT